MIGGTCCQQATSFGPWIGRWSSREDVRWKTGAGLQLSTPIDIWGLGRLIKAAGACRLIDDNWEASRAGPGLGYGQQ